LWLTEIKRPNPCPQCVEGKINAPPAVPSTSPPASKIGEKLFGDFIYFDSAAIGGYIGAVFLVDEKSSFVSISGIKAKNSHAVLAALVEVCHLYNSYGHKIEQIIFDDERIFTSMKSEMGKRGVLVTSTPNGLHNKRAERYIQTFWKRFESTKASLSFELPPLLAFELGLFVVEGMNSVCNSVTGDSCPTLLFTGRRPIVPSYKFGQTGIFYSRRKDSPRQHGEWGIFLSHRYGGRNNLKAYFPFRRGLYSRRKFVPFDVFPEEWDLKPRLRVVNALKPVNSLPNFSVKPQKVLDEMVPQEDDTLLDDKPLNGMLPTISVGNGSHQKGVDRIVPIHPPSAHGKGGRSNQNEESKTAEEDRDVNTVTIDDDDDLQLVDPNNNVPENAAAPLPTMENPHQPVQPVVQPEPAPEPVNTAGREKLHRGSKNQNWKTRFQQSMNSIVMLINRISLAKAMKDKEKLKQTKEAIFTELKNLMENKAMHPVFYRGIKWEHRRNILNCHMFLKDKFLSTGVFDKRKARTVINGNEEDPDNIEETKSPTVNPISVSILLAIAANDVDIDLAAYDIVAAFLGTPIREGKMVYIRMDKRLVSLMVELYPEHEKFIHSGCLYYQLDKMVYGLQEASKAFNDRLDGVLKKLRFVPLEADRCVYQRKTRHGIHRICCHVDDILSFAPNVQARVEFERELGKEFEIKGKHGDLSYLGMTIRRRRDGKIVVMQDGYVEDLLKKYDIQSSKRITSPADNNLLKMNDDDEMLGDPKKFLSLVMALMYLARMTRPDILFATTFLATKAKNPTVKDYEGAIRILHYLHSTRGAFLLFRASDLKLRVFADASYQIHEGSFGHSGIVITLGNNLIFSRSSKQTLVVRSSTEAELIALEDASTYVVWLRFILKELGLNIHGPTNVYQDNKSAIKIAEDGGNFKRTKHLVGRFHYVKQRREKGDLVLKYLSTGRMLPDIMTKPLGIQALLKHCRGFHLFLKDEARKDEE
jgi:hypothetical protein